MDSLGIAPPTVVPHATAYVDEMVEMIGELVRDDIAYETSDGVYLEVAHVAGYGLLAQQSLDSLRAGSRVEINEEKRAPFDFALWKKAKPDEPAWPAPFGQGRPGWHTECVVMALALLGEGFSLHGGRGGPEVSRITRTNAAQAVALGRPFARHWMHNGMVVQGGEKMSKSLGNVVDLASLADDTTLVPTASSCCSRTTGLRGAHDGQSRSRRAGAPPASMPSPRRLEEAAEVARQTVSPSV